MTFKAFMIKFLKVYEERMSEISRDSILSCRCEKEIQRQMKNHFERVSNVKIIEEEFQNIPALDSTKFIITESFTHQNIIITGLKEKVEELNSHIFNKYSHLDKSLIVKIIVSHFERLHNISDNTIIKDAVFNHKSIHTSIELIDKYGNIALENYKLISFEDNRQNDIFIIKEKRIDISGFKQLPDFAIYLNGIPLLTIEVKTLKSGLDLAFKDYKEKKSYQKFLGCIGTDGIKAFITTAPQSFTYFYWDAYGDNVNPLYTTPLENIINEIVLNKDNLIFYFRFCVFEDKSLSGPYLINHRVQQYYTLKKFDTLMKYTVNNNSDDGFKKVVKHVQRSGKSITIKSVVNLIAIKYPDYFKKIYINVPDTVISGGISRTFGDMVIPGTGKHITMIENRKGYIRSVKEHNNDLKVYLMNVQKIPNNPMNVSYDKKDVLIIIDEVHTHQQGKLAQTRHRNFPNASMMTFTATPRMKANRQIIRNTTNEIFSDDNTYLDEFNASDALNLGIVLPIVYEKTNFQQYWDQRKNKQYDDKILDVIDKVIREDNRIMTMISQELDDYEIELSNEDLTDIEFERKMQEHENFLKNREHSKIHTKVLESEVNNVKKSIIPLKLDFIIDDLNNKRKSTFTDQISNKIYFPTKSFWCVDSIEMAIDIMLKIKSLAEDTKNPTTYKGIRFGTDFSKRTEENRTGVLLEDLNGPLLYGEKIISDFESEKENSVDVLIIVGKYLMGYDEKKLVTLYLDTIISEPGRLFQLITRPCTAMKDKQKGFVVDLTMDENNYETFRQALSWYDNEKGINTFILTEDIIKEEKDNINLCVDNIAKILNIDLNNLGSEGIVFNKLLKLSQSDQMFYFDMFRSINQSFKILVSPSYYFESLDVFYHLLHVNKMYYDGLGRPEVIYDKNLIKQIIEETFTHLKIKDIGDIVTYKLIGKSLRNQDQDRITELEYSNRFHKARLFAQRNGPPMLGRMFYDWLEEKLQEIAISNMKSEETQNKINNIGRRIQEEQAKINEKIKTEFNSNYYHYYVHSIMLEHCVSSIFVESSKQNSKVPDYEDNKKTYDDIVLIISKYFTDEIMNKMKINTPTESHLDDYIRGVLSVENGIIKDWGNEVRKNDKFDKKYIAAVYKHVFNTTSADGINMLDMVLSKCIHSIFKHYKADELSGEGFTL